MRDRQRALAVGGDSVIEGRDIGSRRRTAGRGEGVPARRRRRARAPADVRQTRRRRGRPRRRSPKARRARCDQHAAGRRRRPPRHDRAHRRRGRGADRRARGGDGGEPDGRDLGRRSGDDRDGDRSSSLRSACTAPSACRWTAASSSRRITSAGSTRRRSAPRSPRTLYFMAKVEAHRVPGLGQLMRSFGAFSVRRGESDRDAVRTMREIVRDGHALGLFVEGTRQRSGVPVPCSPARRWSRSTRTCR